MAKLLVLWNVKLQSSQKERFSVIPKENHEKSWKFWMWGMGGGGSVEPCYYFIIFIKRVAQQLPKIILLHFGSYSNF